jgi:hypothetical protein
VPNSLQYPLERERDLQRRWNRLLQRTLVTRESRQRRSVSTQRGPSSAWPQLRTPVTHVVARRVGSDDIGAFS